MLDQHFLINEEIAKEITSHLNSGNILEIGPGKGILTKYLNQDNLTIVEKDIKLANELKKQYPKIRIINGDGVELVKKEDFDYIISNLPYSIIEPLFTVLFFKSFKKAIFMVPKGFYTSLIMENSMFSRVSNAFFTTNFLIDVNRDQFEQIPKVDSVVIEIKRKNKPSVQDQIVKKLFMQHEKRAKNAIRDTIIQLFNKTKKESLHVAEDIISQLNLPNTTIARLSGNQFIETSQLICKHLNV